MLPVSHQRASSDAPLEGVLREVVEALAKLDRTPCSPGERRAAEWLAARMESIAGVRVALEDEPSWGTFPPTATLLGLLGVAGAALVLSRRYAVGALLAGTSFMGIVDEAQNGPRVLRRLLRRRRTTVNVIARSGWGEPEGDGSEAETRGPSRVAAQAGAVAAHGARDTLVVLAHHDAPQSGMLFDQTLQRRLHDLAPGLLQRVKTPLPQWWVGLAGPLCTLVAALARRRGLARGGVVVGALGAALVADVWRRETVTGANDNLSGVAALVALAELLREFPLPGMRVLLVSCGAEETLQDGIRAFLVRHREEIHPERTCFVNLDTVGSPHLVMLEGEGPIWMERYGGAWMRDLLASCAQRMEIPFERGLRARASTDSVIPNRAGYPVATLVSLTDWRSPANYHLPSDVPANLDYGTIGDATRLVYELARVLGEEAHGRAGVPELILRQAQPEEPA
jgi:hypothetical protein